MSACVGDSLRDDRSGEIARCRERVGDGAEAEDVAVEQVDPVLGLVGDNPELVAGADDPRRRLSALDLDVDAGALVPERQK